MDNDAHEKCYHVVYYLLNNHGNIFLVYDLHNSKHIEGIILSMHMENTEPLHLLWIGLLMPNLHMCIPFPSGIYQYENMCKRIQYKKDDNTSVLFSLS